MGCTLLTGRSNTVNDGLAQFTAVRGTADVTCFHLAIAQHMFDGIDDALGSLFLTKVFQHQSTGPDLADRIRDSPAGNIGCRAVDRFEHAGKPAFWIDVATRRHGDRAGDAGAKITENISEEVAGYDHVEPVGMVDEIAAQDVNMKLVNLDIGIVLS